MNLNEVVHLCPFPGSGEMPCCGLPPFERRGQRMTVDVRLVTCRDYGLVVR